MSLDEGVRNSLGRSRLRWLGLSVLTAIVVLALLNFFGQRTVDSVADSRAASLAVSAPERLRGDLIFQGRFVIDARRRIARPVLALGPGWVDLMTLNSINPMPEVEHSRGATLRLTFGPLPAGRRMAINTQWQVDPTNVGSRSQDVALYDGDRQLTGIHRTVTVFP